MDRIVDNSRNQLFIFGLFISILFVTLNPSAGRDYLSYYDIIKRIYDGRLSFVKEYFFLFYTKLGGFIGFSPGFIIWQFRIIFFYLFLRFGLRSSENPFLFVCFFFLVPNIFLGSLNALQTWLSISIGIYVLNSNSLKRNIILLFIATGFHIFAIFYSPLLVLKRISKVNLKKIIIISIPIILLTSQIMIFVLTKMGLIKYIYSKSFSIKAIVFIFFLTFIQLLAYSFSKNEKYLTFVVLHIIMFTSLYQFRIDNEIALRSVNFLLPMGWLALDSIVKKFEPKWLVAALIITVMLFNLIITIDPVSDNLW
jgi:hypothetical protein